MHSRKNKIAALAQQLGVDAIMLTSEVNLHYATKFPRLEGMVLIRADGEGVCFTDSRYIEAVTAQVTPMGYHAIEPEGSYPTPATIREYVEANSIEKLGIEDTRMSLAEFKVYQASLPCRLVPIGNGIEGLRRVKEPWEIEQIEAAQRILERGLEKLLPEIRPGAYEDELVARFKYLLAMEGAQDCPSGIILVSGKTTSMPHGQPCHKQIAVGDFVTIDYSVIINGYYCDMTRTFGIGHVSDEMKQVYRIVQEAQLAGIDAFEAGKTGVEVDAAARNVIEKAGYGRYFGHGLGHSLGLEVHENPRANRTDTTVFQTGDVITIEPGIYIPGRFGVRIEDMVCLTSEGKRNLTNFPKELMVL